jgi:tRNA A-37 threonylcarbamoyl transferase component Bud32
MAELPFQLLIKHSFPQNKEEPLTCTALLRTVPGNREVYDGLWNDRGVIVKVFSHKIRAKRHLKREWRGLSQLKERELGSPEPLFYGQTEDGRWAVVVEKIADSSIALDAFNKTTDKLKKLDLLVLVCKELAKQHSKGVLQKDLHFGNFLMSSDKVFALDPGQMRFLSQPLSRRKSISQLALLARCLPASDTESIARLCQEYFNIRGWELGRSDEPFLQKQLTAHRKRGIKKGLKKCLRTSKRYLRIRAGRYLAVFDSGFCDGAEPLDFMEQIDSLMDAGEILKDGNTCYVSSMMWNGKAVAVKRYNHKGLIHSLRHTIKRSRARRGWLNGHRLRMLHIATPKPLCFIEQRRGILVWKSYLVTEYVDGQKLYDFLQDDNVAKDERSQVTEHVKELLERLGKHRISHGDLKHTNILITNSEPMLMDLDAMKVHKWKSLYKVRLAKDLRRLAEHLHMQKRLL